MQLVPSRSIAPLVLGVFSLVVLDAIAAIAQQEQKYSFVDTAIVVRVDTDARQLTLRNDESGRDRVVAIDDATRILIGAEQVPLTRLQAGDRVVVSARREGATPGPVPIADLVEVVIDRNGGPDAPPAGAAR